MERKTCCTAAVTSRLVGIQNPKLERIRAGLARSSQNQIPTEMFHVDTRLARRLGFSVCAGEG